jgi:tetratricopeptide (TPR) repeat protein
MRNTLITLTLAATLAAAGCGNNKSSKSAAKEQWNAARANVLASLARDQYNAGNFDNCARTLKDAMAMQPKSASLRILSSRLAIERGQLELADAELKLAREFEPRNPEADYLSGVVQQRWANPEGALVFYDAALAKNSGEISYLLAKAETLVALGREDEALTALKDRVVFYEHSAAIRDAIGQLLMQRGETAAAIDMLRQASILATDDKVIREHLALALFQGNRPREAGDMLAKLVKDDPYATRGDLWTALGECRLQEGDLRAARESFETAARLQPASAGVFLCIGKVALKTADYKRAELALRKSISLDGSSAEANLLLGYLRLKQDRFEEALHAFQRATLLDGGDSVSQCMVGFAMMKLGRHDEAVQYYGKVLQQHPNDPLAARLMATIDIGE